MIILEVVRRVRIAQVPQAVQPHARRHAPVKLCFGGRIGSCAGRGDAPRERGVLELLHPASTASLAEV
jgi:hypothetical protein